MGINVLIVKRRRRFIPVCVDARANTVSSTLSKRAARLTGCSAAFVVGTGERSVTNLLTNDLESFDSIVALRESFAHDDATITRVTTYDR